MNHPLAQIPEQRRAMLFLPLLFFALALMVILYIQGMPMQTPAAPSGIVSFELAGTLEKAQQILASWDINARLSAAFSLGLDYLFMPAYSTAIGLACVMAGAVLQKRRWPLAGLAPILAWGAWLAALFDAVENVALARLLFGALVSPWPEIARGCAVFKFALVIAGLIYALLGFIASLIPTRTKGENMLPG